MFLRAIKPILLIICIVGLIFLPMSDIFLHRQSMDTAVSDFMRVTSEQVEHTDYHSSDITTFVNDYFIFYVPPPTVLMQDRIYTWWAGYEDTTYRSYPMANFSNIQFFSYENGAKIRIEWLNGTAINDTIFDCDLGVCGKWVLGDGAEIVWLDQIQKPENLTKTIHLGEYETRQIQINTWMVGQGFRMISGIVKVTSNYPISVMHHKLFPMGTMDDRGYDYIVDYYWDGWEGIYSAYGKKIFTRITGDCWISALEADTTVNVWDYSDKNDDATLILDRFEGWDYTRNPIFEQYGFDDDLVLISADKPVSIVAGIQSDQGFVQVFGKDGKDFLFPCFGKILISAPTGATIDLKDKNGNQGTFKGYLNPGELRLFDFKVAYKLREYSSYEWAHLRSSDPILVYTFANSTWYLREDNRRSMSGEEYFTVYKKITEFYPHGWVPYPASTEFEIPIWSQAYLTVVNLREGNNDVEVDFDMLIKPYSAKMDVHESVTFDFSESSYYYMDMMIEDTQFKQPPEWTTRDPHNYYALDSTPRIAVDDGDSEEIHLDWENITLGSTVKVKSKHPVMVFINYNRDQRYLPQGIDLIPGLTPPTKRGLPEIPTLIVAVSGLIIAADLLMIPVGRRSLVEVF
ncbi:MAG: hypothetical protein JSW00_01775 [Thermoplasmata archaeon]|nr:MAG: hypothetical protein JSW00_01775 [Thermoplasmata archaeon]